MNGFDVGEIEQVIKKGKDNIINPTIMDVIYSLGRDAGNDEEYQYAFDTLLSIYDGATDRVRAYVVLGFSLLAVMHEKLDREIVEPIIRYEWGNVDAKNKSVIQEALSDINFALKWDMQLK